MIKFLINNLFLRHVVLLTKANYDSFLKEVKDSGKSIYVEYFAPWCPHCKKFKPVWEKVAESFKNDVKLKNDFIIASVNCEADEAICEKVVVESYPTIKVLRLFLHFC